MSASQPWYRSGSTRRAHRGQYIAGLAGRTHPGDRRRPWNIRIRHSKRLGFVQLVTSVLLGEVGAVFGLEISRLARLSADLLKLLELCRLFGTLVIDEGRIYDMSDFNDRLPNRPERHHGRSETSFPSCPYDRRERKCRFQGRTTLSSACRLYLWLRWKNHHGS